MNRALSGDPPNSTAICTSSPEACTASPPWPGRLRILLRNDPSEAPDPWPGVGGAEASKALHVCPSLRFRRRPLCNDGPASTCLSRRPAGSSSPLSFLRRRKAFAPVLVLVLVPAVLPPLI